MPDEAAFVFSPIYTLLIFQLVYYPNIRENGIFHPFLMERMETDEILLIAVYVEGGDTESVSRLPQIGFEHLFMVGLRYFLFVYG